MRAGSRVQTSGHSSDPLIPSATPGFFIGSVDPEIPPPVPPCQHRRTPHRHWANWWPETVVVGDPWVVENEDSLKIGRSEGAMSKGWSCNWSSWWTTFSNIHRGVLKSISLYRLKIVVIFQGFSAFRVVGWKTWVFSASKHMYIQTWFPQILSDFSTLQLSLLFFYHLPIPSRNYKKTSKRDSTCQTVPAWTTDCLHWLSFKDHTFMVESSVVERDPSLVGLQHRGRTLGTSLRTVIKCYFWRWCIRWKYLKYHHSATFFWVWELDKWIDTSWLVNAFAVCAKLWPNGKCISKRNRYYPWVHGCRYV